MIAGRLTQLFEEGPHCIEFRAKAGPIPCFQPRYSAVVVIESLSCSKVCRARASCRGEGWEAEGRCGYPEEGCQRLGERFLHDHDRHKRRSPA